MAAARMFSPTSRQQQSEGRKSLHENQKVSVDITAGAKDDQAANTKALD